jgi:uncharacterized membrane protein YcaP (DUF421 family)
VPDALRDLLLVVGQSLAIYLFLIVAMTRLGRREMAQLTILEYLVIALLGSAVETGLYAGNASLPAGLVSAATLLATNRGFAFLVNRSPMVRRFFITTPVVLVHDSQIVWPHLRGAHLTEKDVMAAIRSRGYDSLDDVHLAVLEVNGLIAVVPRKPESGASG